MRISDWSSDVCSSDLSERASTCRTKLVSAAAAMIASDDHSGARIMLSSRSEYIVLNMVMTAAVAATLDSRVPERRVSRPWPAWSRQIGRASCREGGCQLRVVLGGRRSIKKKNRQLYYKTN